MSEEIVLNEGQRKAEEGFFSFLFSTKTEMAITGPGGTGKTFLLSRMIDNILPKYKEMVEIMGGTYKYDEVVFTATTNKAAEVMAVATNRSTQTIYSFLNLTVFNDYETGKTSIRRNPKKWEVHYNKIIVIDEASMANYELLKELRDATANCKIIFIGDDCQLTPVMSSDCPAFNQDIPIYELTEPMRNAEFPDLQKLCDHARNNVKTGELLNITTVPGVIDWLSDEEMQRELDTLFIDPALPQRIVCYTNRRVGQYNEYIRGVRELDQLYTEGEVLVNNAMCRLPTGQMLSVEQEVTIVKRLDGREQTLPDGTTLDVIDCIISMGYNGTATVMLPADPKHHQDLLKYYKKQKMWGMYYHLQETYPDLRPKDASTSHKAQGSSYDTTYIDLTNLSTITNADAFARSFYVAVSRSRKRVVFYGQLAPRFGQIVRKE